MTIPGIRFTSTLDGITSDRLRGFFVGWPNPPSPHTHERILKGSRYVELAIDEASGQVIGFVNAIADGVLAAYLPLLEVLPEFQHRGIGSELMRRIVARLDGYYMIDLVCLPRLESFYAPLGVRADFAMTRRNFAVQCGIPE